MEITRRHLVGVLAAAATPLRQRDDSPAPPRGPLPRIQSDADVATLLPRITNWGRWGEEDQRGTLNFLTPAHRVRAMRAVRSGRMVSLARQTSLKSEGVREGRHEVLSGDGAARDIVGFVPHGFALTHLDALCHAFASPAQLYNGVPSSVVAPAGVQKLDANAMGDGICGRGVLLDVGRQRGGGLEPGTAIRVDDLERAEHAGRLTVSEGDVLLVRTGAGPRNTRERRSGLHPECLPWLHARRVALLGGDGDNDVHPLDGFDRWASAMHSVGIPYLGLPLIDNLELDALGRACAEERRWTFLFTVAPWRLTGTTSSLVNPLATF